MARSFLRIEGDEAERHSEGDCSVGTWPAVESAAAVEAKLESLANIFEHVSDMRWYAPGENFVERRDGDAEESRLANGKSNIKFFKCEQDERYEHRQEKPADQSREYVNVAKTCDPKFLEIVPIEICIHYHVSRDYHHSLPSEVLTFV